MKKDKIANLRIIAKLKFLQDQEALMSIAKRQLELDKTTARLEQSRHIGNNGAQNIKLEKQFSRWNTWIDQSQSKINIEYFSLLARQEYTVKATQHSFGRLQAIDSITKL